MMAVGNGSRVAIGATEMPVYEGYDSVRRIGLGAASVIYLVKHRQSGEMRALKHVIRQDGADKRMIEQVENEYRVASKLEHPYVRKVFEIQRRKKRMQTSEVQLLMEYCPGVSLEQSPSRSLLDLLLIFRMVADGLQGMHVAGYLHCDIKPNNIIISEKGAVRIIDLGQSCPEGTVKKRIQGTPDYIAPEQVKRKALSPRTDVFNLGATMYWSLTGKYVPTLIPKSNGADLAMSSKPAGALAPHEIKPKIPMGVSKLTMDCISNLPQHRPDDMPMLISRLDLLIHMIAGGKLKGQNQK